MRASGDKTKREKFSVSDKRLNLTWTKDLGEDISYRTRGEDLSGMKSYHNRQQKKEKMIPCKTGLVELFAFWYLVYMVFLNF